MPLCRHQLSLRAAIAYTDDAMLPTRFVIALVLACLASVGTPAQTSDPFVGTWKLNVAQSKTTFKSGTTVVESTGDGIKTTADMVRGDGTADHTSHGRRSTTDGTTR